MSLAMSARVRSNRLSSRRLARACFRLSLDRLEDRSLPSGYTGGNPAETAPLLNVVLVSDQVAQAEQVRAAAVKDTIAIGYQSDGMHLNEWVDIPSSVSAAHQ